MRPNDFPIFFDPSGRRWRRAKQYTLIIVTTLAVTIAVTAYAALRRVDMPEHNTPSFVSQESYPVDTRSPVEIAYGFDYEVPIIGEGVFLRFVRLHASGNGKVAADIYSGKVTKALSKSEAASVGDKEYAIERYGSTEGKYIVLTFDDGPDPIYTPQILDVLSQESVHSSFFPIGANAVKYPEVVQRIAKEGHDVANHTFTHADLDLVGETRAEQEINQTQRVLRAVTKHNTSLFRIPYGGHDDHSIQDDRRAILEAQRLGFVVAGYNINSNDWEYTAATKVKMPDLHDGVNVVLLHDGGGNRSKTVEYVRELVRKAKAEGYEFTSLSRLLADPSLNQTTSATVADRAAYVAASAAIVWPKKLLNGLFVTTVFLIFITVVVGIILAELQMLMMKPARRRKHYNPLVSVIVPSYNEEKVLEKTVQHILRSHYKNLEVIIVDDGSSDDTWKVAKRLRRRRRVIGLRLKQNAGKAAAMNRALEIAEGEVIVSVDADTIFLPQTIGKLVRYFYYPEIGAVAGVVKVGNINNWITKWQALEYITSINIERAAQAYLHAIAVVPGACSAWRKEAILDAGGYSSVTLAEDCDMTLAVQKAGYSVVQDMHAIAYTESPETLRMLAKQRFRWLFGNLQSFWKHRDMFLRPRYGWLGMYVLPKALFSLLIQLLFAPILFFVTIGNLLSGELLMMLFYLLGAYILLFITAAVALLFARERYSYLSATPAFRLVYSPLRTLLLYASVLAALGGLELGWNKVTRNGSVDIGQ